MSIERNFPCQMTGELCQERACLHDKCIKMVTSELDPRAVKQVAADQSRLEELHLGADLERLSDNEWDERAAIMKRLSGDRA